MVVSTSTTEDPPGKVMRVERVLVTGVRSVVVTMDWMTGAVTVEAMTVRRPPVRQQGSEGNETSPEFPTY